MNKKGLDKKGLVVAIILLFISVSVIPSTAIVVEKKSTILTFYDGFYDGDTLYVGGSGPRNYSKIQGAIDDASDGDTVFVYDDSSPYYENVLVDKSINLIGENKDTTIIDGMRNDDVVSIITTDGVSINGFTIQNCSGHPGGFAGVHLSSSHNNIVYNNIIKENGMRGIELFYSYNNAIYENVLTDNVDVGILIVKSKKNIVYNNTISGSIDAIEISKSENNSIYKNNINQNHYGITFYYSGYNKVYRNSITNNIQEGISLFYSSPEHGYCSYNEIFENLISSNQNGNHPTIGIKTSDASNNYFYHNNFFDNTQNAYDECDNSWDDGYPSGGNYWDDYDGVDNDGDGIGDTPYDVPGGGNQDLYPLMYPYGNRVINLDTGEWFSTIQGAIDDFDTLDGHTIFAEGTFYENVVIHKSINLIGENRNSTVIDGGGIGKVVSIITDDVSFTGFTIQNSGSGPYMGGIDVYSNNSCISNNIIRWNDFYGIDLHYSNDNTITDNTIVSNIETGIELWCSNNNTFANNIISENKFGIWYSNNNIISKNYITNNSRAMSLFNSKNNSILDNNLSFNVDAISLLYLSNYNTVSGNIIFTNWDSITIHKTGIKINRSEGNSIHRNSISQHMFGILLENSSLNEITCNNLRRNIINAYFQSPDGGVNAFNNNYWNRPRLLPKPILGTRTIGSRSIPWVNFDLHPAKMPYEI